MDKQNVVYPHKEYYPVLIKIEVYIHAATWVNLDDIKMEGAP